MRHAFASLLAVASLSAMPLQAAVFRVGGAGCTHSSIQSAVDAADANFGPDVILVTTASTAQAIRIDTNDSLTIAGGLAACFSDFYVDDLVDVNGAGGSAASVFHIKGGPSSVVRLVQMRIRNGDPSTIDGLGGGIHYEGSGVLELENVAVTNNRAVKGGGIYADGDTETARLVFRSRVTVSANVARIDGGGVFVNGMKFDMVDPDSIIAFNVAEGNGGTGYGGGLVVRSTGGREANANVASAGVGMLGAIYGNRAKRGGGVAVSAGNDASAWAYLHLYSVDPERPAAIRGNFASERGGAIYLWPNRSFSFDARAYGKVWRAELTGNAAPEGAAVSADFSDLELRDAVGGDLEVDYRAPPGALPCPANQPCSRIADNIAEDGAGVDTDGAVIHLHRGSTLKLGRGAWVHRNLAGRIVDGRPTGDLDKVRIEIDQALIVDNAVRRELLRAEFDANLSIVDSTIANNAIGAAHVITADRSNVVLRRSILWQPGTASLTASGGEPAIESVITSDATTLDGGPNAIVAPPRFIDPARGDYRLRAASQAIDFAAPVQGLDVDAYGQPRDVRITAIPRTIPTNSRDVGAFERQGLQPLLLNGEFAGDTNLWFLPVGHVGNFQVVDAPGSTAGSGSAQVANAGVGAAKRIFGYAQCIEIPGPGTYALNASGRSVGDPALSNPTALIWELRPDGGAGCLDGPITVSGVHFVSSAASTDQWARPAHPALIQVPNAVWNVRTSLTVILTVYANASDDSFNGLFDRVTLEPAGPTQPPPDALFSNGFE